MIGLLVVLYHIIRIEVQRDIEKGYKENKINIVESENIKELCFTAERKLYGAAYEAALDDASFSASSLDMRQPLWEISTMVGQLSEGLNVLSDNIRQAAHDWGKYAIGTSSTSANASLGSSIEGVGGKSFGNLSDISKTSTLTIEQKREAVKK